MARLLVVDGSTDGSSGISRHLREAGHEAFCASDAAAALALIERNHFDAVNADWHLADASALDLAARLDRDRHGSGARIVVTGNQIMAEDVVRALESGIDDRVARNCCRRFAVSATGSADRPPFGAGLTWPVAGRQSCSWRYDLEKVFPAQLLRT